VTLPVAVRASVKRDTVTGTSCAEVKIEFVDVTVTTGVALFTVTICWALLPM
jgi:hypothetical protein